jgi:D-arabinose 1-dehydrogenase-like Zn-dependent alcohol dehydrogenase
VVVAVAVEKEDKAGCFVERDIPKPGIGKVRIKVQACGICHGDSATKEGIFPGIQYPKVPGHEIAGVIDAIGNDVTEWNVGQRVGLLGIVATVYHAGAVISLPVDMDK